MASIITFEKSAQARPRDAARARAGPRSAGALASAAAGVSGAAAHREICLVDGTSIAGTRHVPGIEEAARDLCVGMPLVFERDGGNAYDPWAVRVRDARGRRLGYVSCEYNEIVARLMDGGKHVYGRAFQTRRIDGWTCIEMGVFLDD